ncbi:MAG: class C sortase [Eubacteriales bacterium]|nr:class C sortase [Eubacteriales bacterium]
MKKHLSTFIFILIFLLGLGILMYPAVSDYVNEKHASRAIASYDDSVEELAPEDYTKDLEDARAYNAYLSQFSNLSVAARSEMDRTDSPYESLLDVTGSGIMGTINIPSIDVRLPIYHGTDEGVLQVAVGHYLGSSLPIGGESTHAILTGHRGLPSARLFTDLDRLEVGDIFYLKVLGEILEYQIDQIEIVLPHEMDSLAIEEGHDYVTLVTCTPYGINSHRMLVRGSRIAYDGNYEEKVPMKPAPKDSDVPPEVQGRGLSQRQWTIIAVMAFAAAILSGLLLPGKKSNGKKQKTAEGSKNGREEGGHSYDEKTK